MSVLGLLGLSIVAALGIGALSLPMELAVTKIHDNARVRKTLRWIFLIPEGVDFPSVEPKLRHRVEDLGRWARVAFWALATLVLLSILLPFLLF